MSRSKRDDADKQRYWQRVIREAARSGLSTRAFCRQRRIKEPQFYWWQRKLKNQQQARTLRRRGTTGSPSNDGTSFALVSDDPAALAAGIELVLANGRRLRIAQGVDEETLRTVLAALEAERC